MMLETGHITCLWIVDSEVGPFSCEPKNVVRGPVGQRNGLVISQQESAYTPVKEPHAPGLEGS